MQKVAKKVPKNAHHRILFNIEKIFKIEEKLNRQNDIVHAKNCYEAEDKIPQVRRGHHLPLVMVCWQVSYPGATQIHFCNTSVKTNGEIYRVTLNHVK